MTSMIDAKKHLVTIIYNPAYDDIKGIIMYGDDETYSHANAINNIERKMAYAYDWPQITYNERLSQIKIYKHCDYDNIVIANNGFNGVPVLYIYLPENIDDERIETIKEFINENREYIKELAICNSTEEQRIDIDSFLHNKTKKFTIIEHINRLR